MSYDADREARLKLAYQVGALEGFLKYGLTLARKMKDAEFDAFIEARIKEIEADATEHSKR